MTSLAIGSLYKANKLASTPGPLSQLHAIFKSWEKGPRDVITNKQLGSIIIVNDYFLLLICIYRYICNILNLLVTQFCNGYFYC